MQSVSTLCSNQEGRGFSFKCQCHKHVQSGKYFLSKQPCVAFTELVMKELQLQLEDFSLPRSLQMLQCGGEALLRAPQRLTAPEILAYGHLMQYDPIQAEEPGQWYRREKPHPVCRKCSTEFTPTLPIQTPNQRTREVISLVTHLNRVSSAKASKTQKKNHQLVIRISGCYTLHCQRIPTKLHFGTILWNFKKSCLPIITKNILGKI